MGEGANDAPLSPSAVTAFVTGGKTKYTYDVTNRMVKGEKENGEKSSYIYNGLGDLVSTEKLVWQNLTGFYNVEVNGVLACDDAWDMWIGSSGGLQLINVIAEYTLDYTSTLKNVIMEGNVRYTYGLQKIGSSDGQYYHQDRLGSVVEVSNNAGAVVASVEYDDWGVPNKPGYAEYTGHMWDDVLGMWYARARMYDSGNRRFAAQDVIKGGIENMLSANQYAYCFGNPVKYVDLTGLSPVVIMGGKTIPAIMKNGDWYVNVDDWLAAFGINNKNNGLRIENYPSGKVYTFSYNSVFVTMTVYNSMQKVAGDEYQASYSVNSKPPSSMKTPHVTTSNQKKYVSTSYFLNLMCALNKPTTVQELLVNPADYSGSKKTAMERINNMYLTDSKVRNKINNEGKAVFAFEGLGGSGRYRAMFVVMKGSEVLYITSNGSTLTDKPDTAAKWNDGTTMKDGTGATLGQAILKSGSYDYHSSMHNGSVVHPGMRAGTSGSDTKSPVYRSWTKDGKSYVGKSYDISSKYAGTGVNIHAGEMSSGSTGCQIIRFDDYLKFAAAVGYIDSKYKDKKIESRRELANIPLKESAVKIVYVVNRQSMSSDQKKTYHLENFGGNP